MVKKAHKNFKKIEKQVTKRVKYFKKTEKLSNFQGTLRNRMKTAKNVQ
jgi:hypothetical protein